MKTTSVSGGGQVCTYKLPNLTKLFIFSLQGAISKKKEFEKMASEGKVNPGESTEISNRTNTLSFALMAEINTFHHQRVKDMKTAHQHFLQEQIAFYHKVSIKIPQKKNKKFFAIYNMYLLCIIIDIHFSGY